MEKVSSDDEDQLELTKRRLMTGKNYQENIPVKCIPPHIFPLLYSKTGVYRGIPIFLIFAPKHRLCVLVRTASPSFSR